MPRNITPEEQSAIRKGELAQQILDSPGWQLVLDEMELINTRALDNLRKSDSADWRQVVDAKRKWEMTDKILSELQLAMQWHVEFRKQTMHALKADTIEGLDPMLASELADMEPEDSAPFTY